MFNVAVLKMKDIIKYFVGAIVLIMVIIVVTKYFSVFQENGKKVKEKIDKQTQIITTNISQNTFLSCFDATIPVAANINKEYNSVYKEDDTNNDKNIFEEMLKTQMSAIKGIEEVEEKVNLETAQKEQTNQNNIANVKAAEAEQTNKEEEQANRYINSSNRFTYTSNYTKSDIREF